jgi:hypothetical protein
MTISTDDLLGGWRLVSAEAVFDDGECRPEFGPTADGYLSYTPDGVVSATLGSTDRPTSGASDPLRASDSDVVLMSRDFIAYAGRFTVDADKDTVTHHIQTASFTDWQGSGQERHVQVRGDLLLITRSPGTSADGRSFRTELTWERVRS